MRRRALLLALAALLHGAPPGEARIVRVQTPDGPVWTNIPEPAAGVDAKPGRRAERWRPLIASAAARHGVDAGLVEAVIACESDFRPEAVSRAGACGLMQLMPATAKIYGLDDPFDPEGNVDAGTQHLAGLLESFGGDRRLAIAAYNAGEGAVRRSGGIPPYRETMRYVEKVQRYLSLLGGEAALRRPQVPAKAAAKPASTQSIRMGRDSSGRLVLTNLPASARSGQ